MTWLLAADTEAPADRIGGKAAALAALGAAGLPVPAWFVVVPEACMASCPGLADAPDPAALEVLLAAARPSAALLAELRVALAGLSPDGAPLAVRSSARDEDSAAHSFAGQLVSFLNVPPAAVAARIVDVWRSGFSPQVCAYRRAAGLAGLPAPPAVIVQRCIDGEVSGVAFSADPVSGRRGTALVSAVWGLCAGLVGGDLDADTWRVGRDGAVLPVALARKPTAWRSAPDEPEGIACVAVPAARVEIPCLDLPTVVEVAALARAAEAHFGRPQDIEWTRAGAQLFLLQSRPITTLAGRPDPDGRLAIWDNSNVVESYGGVTTPFTFSFARRAYAAVYRNFARLMGVPRGVVEAHAAVFGSLVGLVRGRVYYNLLSGYRVLALLPGFRRNSTYIERMLGLRGTLPPAVAAGLAAEAVGSRAGDAWRVLRGARAVLVNYLTLGRRVRRFHPYLEATMQDAGKDLATLRLDELAGRYRALEERLLEHWDAPVLNDFYLMIFHGVLARLTSRWVGERSGTLCNDLLCGERQMLSREVAERIRDMARLAASDPEVSAALADGEYRAARAALNRLPALQAAFADYLAAFGERCVDELKLESATLHDNPLPLWRAVGHYARRLAAEGEPEVDRDRTVRAAAEARVAAALGGRPLRRRLFAWVLRNTRSMVCNRENLRFQRTRGFGLARRIAVETGHRLAALGWLDAAQDVFYLTVEELLALDDGTAVTTDLAALVALRRAEFAAYRDGAEPAARFNSHGSVYLGAPWRLAATPLPADGETLYGIGCCPGLVRGPVRVVRDPGKAQLRSGEILVAERTDPGWVMLFPAAAGLLVERGSVLSHSAIVARELGLPTVVAIEHLTAWLRDGEWVEMDGMAGSVRRVAAPDGADADADADAA